MPTYLYKGLESGEVFEFKQSMHDAPLEQHPETGEKVKRIVARPGIVFKGSGFYATDNRPKDGAKESAPQKSAADGGAKAASAAPSAD